MGELSAAALCLRAELQPGDILPTPTVPRQLRQIQGSLDQSKAAQMGPRQPRSVQGSSDGSDTQLR